MQRAHRFVGLAVLPGPVLSACRALQANESGLQDEDMSAVVKTVLAESGQK